MSVYDAQPEDLYIDASGKLWRIVGICGEPTVIAEEVETVTPKSKVRKSGGMSGFMWEGFKRIYRPDLPSRPKDWALR